jgi:hypothetical protein
MQIKFFRLALLPTITALLFSCSDFDQYTGVGTDVVEESDPSFTKFEDNFDPFFQDSSIINESYSIPQDPNHHFRYTSLLAAGNDSGFETVAFLTFTVPAELALTSDSTTIDSGIRIDSVMFSIFAYTDSTDSAGFSELSLYRSHPADDEEPLVTCSRDEDNDTMLMYTGVCSDSTFIDSLNTFYTNYRNCIDACNTDDCEADCDEINRSFTVMLVLDDSMYVFSTPPYLIIFSHLEKYSDSEAQEDSLSQIDTVSGTTYSEIHESDDVISSLSGIPVSKRKSKRTAVFNLNFSDLWEESSKTGFSEILSAVVSFPRETMEINASDSSAINVRYFLSGKTMSDYSESDAYFSDTLLYYSETKTFSSTGSDTVHFPIEHYLYKFQKTQPTELNLYLQVEPYFIHDDIEITWSKPSFKAVLTSLK